MNLPDDPFKKYRHIFEQANNPLNLPPSVLQSLKEIDKVQQYSKLLRNSSYEQLTSDYSTYPEKFNQKLLSDFFATKSLKESLKDLISSPNQNLEDIFSLTKRYNTEQHWLDSMRKIIEPLNPIQDLLNFGDSTASLKKYAALMVDDPLPIFDRALNDLKFITGTHEWSNASEILRTLHELDTERRQWELNDASPSNSDDGDQVLTNVIPDQITGSSDEIIELLHAILSSLRNIESSLTLSQRKSFWKEASPYLFSLFLFALTPVWDVYGKRIIERFDPVPMTQPAREANKAVKAKAHKLEIASVFISDLRFIDCKKSLRLRTTPKTNAEILLMEIPRGQVVQVLDLGRDWTKIRWSNSGEDFIIEGWVHTRYLKKLN